MSTWFDQQLLKLEEQLQIRQLRCFTNLPGGMIIDENAKKFINFASNDYLGLSAHEQLVAAACNYTARFGVGSGASRLVVGTSPLHHALELRMAEIKKTQACVCFSSGFAMASSLIPALMDQNCVIILDKLSHACLVDGAKASKATLRVFKHNDLQQLQDHLRWARAKFPQETRILIVVESVYSMDGDQAPLAEIVALKHAYNAELLVDEAHSFGLLGDKGAGLAAQLGLGSADIDYQMGTFSKAIGVSGGYLACSSSCAKWIINRCRSFIYSTAPPPGLAGTILSALDLMQSEEGDRRRAHLRALAARMRQIIAQPGGDFQSAIFPYLLGSNGKALQFCMELQERFGILAPAIRYPTVPRGSARLRFTLTANHGFEQLEQLAAALQQLACENLNE